MASDRSASLSGTVAAIVYPPGSRIEEFFAALAARLAHDGIAVAGLLQHSLRVGAHDRCAFELEDLWSGRRYAISQALGEGSDACSIDHAAIAAASVVLRQAIATEPDVVLVNKFGALEAAGEGMREEMNQIVAAGLLLVTTVSEAQVSAWRHYVGTDDAELPVDLATVAGWVATRVRRSVR